MNSAERINLPRIRQLQNQQVVYDGQRLDPAKQHIEPTHLSLFTGEEQVEQGGISNTPSDTDNGPIIFRLPGLDQSPESSSAQAWIGNQRETRITPESEIAGAAERLPSGQVDLPSHVEAILDEQSRSSSDDGGNRTPPPGPPQNILPFKTESPAVVEKAEEAPAPVQNSGPSLAMVLTGIGFLASTTVSILAHFTEAFDTLTEPVRFCFDSLAVVLACLLTILTVGGKERNKDPYSEAEG